MSFAVPAQAYGRFMGRFSEPLSEVFADFAGVAAGSAVDVGCGPGALTRVLIDRLGAANVKAVDPSEPFVAAARQRFPECDVRQASAEALPFEDDSFDLALAQLVVHFMADPVHGLAEMLRVTRPGGVVAACVWDHAGDGSPLSLFWRAVKATDPSAHDESALAGATRGDLTRLLNEAGAEQVTESSISVQVPFASYDEWWEPFTLGVGPAGEYVAGLDDVGKEAVRAACEDLLPPEPFVVTATAWAARAH